MWKCGDVAVLGEVVLNSGNEVCMSDYSVVMDTFYGFNAYHYNSLPSWGPSSRFGSRSPITHLQPM